MGSELRNLNQTPWWRTRIEITAVKLYRPDRFKNVILTKTLQLFHWRISNPKHSLFWHLYFIYQWISCYCYLIFDIFFNFTDAFFFSIKWFWLLRPLLGIRFRIFINNRIWREHSFYSIINAVLAFNCRHTWKAEKIVVKTSFALNLSSKCNVWIVVNSSLSNSVFFSFNLFFCWWNTYWWKFRHAPNIVVTENKTHANCIYEVHFIIFLCPVLVSFIPGVMQL